MVNILNYKVDYILQRNANTIAFSSPYEEYLYKCFHIPSFNLPKTHCMLYIQNPPNSAAFPNIS